MSKLNRHLNRRRDERGATAILFAVVALVLLGVSALAVDLGQVYAKRAALQSNVDLAVLAAASELTSDGACNPEVATKATEYLLKAGNLVPDQTAVDLGGSAGDGNGFIECNDWGVELWAPTSHVDFGLAGAVMDEDSEEYEAGVDVPAHAATQIKSPSQSHSLPMYAVSGCDLGHQQITDPPSGPPPVASVPDLTPDGPPYNTVNNLAITSPNPAEVDEGLSAPIPMQIQGRNLGPIAPLPQVWFTNAAGEHFQASIATPTLGPGPQFTINVNTVPQEVLDRPGIWYVRVFNEGRWSEEADAQPFVVGDLLFCDGHVSGNFGTLKVARSTGSTATWLEQNIIHGFEPLLQINASSAVPCSPEDSTHAPQSPTDCVGTDPGFPGEAATDGLVNGSGGDPGRLDQDTTPGCDRNGGSSRTQSGPEPLNDDVLSCYVTGGHSVGDVVAGMEGILSADIFKSPRFFQIPVIPVEAAHGSSTSYPIIDFRPGFITEEALTATQGNPGSLSGHNGVLFHGHNVEQLNVLLFPESALPTTAPPVGGEIDYVGHGTKVIVLVK